MESKGSGFPRIPLLLDMPDLQIKTGHNSDIGPQDRRLQSRPQAVQRDLTEASLLPLHHFEER
jgi:hypothetical protein